jgi:N-acetyl-gamma-glutamyl-phosphate reductase
MIKVFVDGQEGTTGLKIHERLTARADVELLQIDPEKRKDTAARKELLNAADVAFLCLPDAAARESAALVSNPSTRLVDPSTAHRTDPAWTYGLPELSASQRNAVAQSKRVAVPGCHATGFNIIAFPLVKQGIAPADYPFTCHSITGYSGGGKKLIGSYEAADRKSCFKSPRHYAMALQHKHLPEMKHVCGLTESPVFDPICGDFYQGMAVSVPLHTRLLKKPLGAPELHAFFSEYYGKEKFVRVMPLASESYLDEGFFDPTACNGTNRLDLFIFGHATQAIAIARLDNLGKGASGAAIQCMNIMLGLDEGVSLKA